MRAVVFRLITGKKAVNAVVDVHPTGNPLQGLFTSSCDTVTTKPIAINTKSVFSVKGNALVEIETNPGFSQRLGDYISLQNSPKVDKSIPLYLPAIINRNRDVKSMHAHFRQVKSSQLLQTLTAKAFALIKINARMDL